MRPTHFLRATHYKPMIHFLGPRKNIKHAPHAPAAHPCSPPEIVENFQSFLAKLQSTSGGAENPSSTPKAQNTEESSKGIVRDEESKNTQKQASGGSGVGKGSGGGSGKPVDFENFWEAPKYLWVPREMSEFEMESVMSGGATDIRSGP